VRGAAGSIDFSPSFCRRNTIFDYSDQTLVTIHGVTWGWRVVEGIGHLVGPGFQDSPPEMVADRAVGVGEAFDGTRLRGVVTLCLVFVARTCEFVW